MFGQNASMVRIILIVLTVGAAAIVSFYGTSGPRLLPLRLRDESSSLGDVWQTDKLVWPATIENVTDNDIVIDGFLSGCSCLKAPSRGLIVPARKSAAVSLTFDFSDAQPIGTVADGPQSIRTEAKLMPIIHGQDGLDTDTSSMFFWLFTANVRVAFKVESRFIDFGEVLLVDNQVTSRSIILRKHAEIDAVSVTAEEEFVKPVVTKRADVKDELDLTVSLLPTSRKGLVEGDLKICGATKSGQRIVSTLRYRVVLLSDFYCLPEAVLTGPRAVGDVVAETIRVASRRGHEITSIAWEAKDDIVRVTELADKGDGTKWLSIRATIRDLGRLTSSVQLTLRSADGLVSTLTVPVQMHGLRMSGSSDTAIESWRAP